MTDLSDVQDELNIARNFVEAAFMACESLPKEHGAPLCAVLDAASDKMKAIYEAIGGIKGHSNAD